MARRRCQSDVQALLAETLVDDVAERGQPRRFVSESLGGRGDFFRSYRCDLRLGPRAGLVELRQPPLRVRTHNVVFRSRVLLRTDPAMRSDVEDGSVEVGVLRFLAVWIVRVAHDPVRASAARDLALFHHAIDLEANVVGADIVRAGAL
jgi:hypothetical protein